MPTRGLRNNNPGNIDKGRDEWEGQELPGDDPRFCTFTSMAYGCRALIRTLMTYRMKHGLSTVREIINRWAPPVENNTLITCAGALASRRIILWTLATLRSICTWRVLLPTTRMGLRLTASALARGWRGPNLPG